MCIKIKSGITAILIGMAVSFSFGQKAELDKVAMFVKNERPDKAKLTLDALLIQYPNVITEPSVMYYQAKIADQTYRSTKAEGITETLLLAIDKYNSCISSTNSSNEFSIASASSLKKLADEVVYNQAVKAYNVQDYPKSLAYFQLLIKIDPKTSYYQFAAISADQMDSTRLAYDLYTALAKKEKQEADIYKRLIWLSIQTSQTVEQQMEWINIGIAYFADDKYFYEQKARMLELKKDPKLDQEIEGIYKKILSLDNSNDVALYNLAVMYYNKALSFEQNNNKRDAYQWYRECQMLIEAHLVRPDPNQDITNLAKLLTDAVVRVKP